MLLYILTIKDHTCKKNCSLWKSERARKYNFHEYPTDSLHWG